MTIDLNAQCPLEADLEVLDMYLNASIVTEAIPGPTYLKHLDRTFPFHSLLKYVSLIHEVESLTERWVYRKDVLTFRTYIQI